MSKKAVFLDIDGTLLPRGAEGPVAKDAQALRRAVAAGHIILINTGRSFGFVPPSLKQADYISGILAGCGAHLILNGETIFCRRVDRSDLRTACRLMLSTPGRHCYFECENGMLEIGTFPGRKSLVKVTHEDDFETVFKDINVTKLTVTSPITEEDRAVLEPMLDLVVWRDWYEAVPKGCNKGSGLLTACEMLGIAPEDSIAIGDGVNDLDMLRCAGTAVAMGNAEPEVKEAADMVTGICGEGGVADALEKLLGI